MAIVDMTGYTSAYLQASFRPSAHSRGYRSALSGAASYGVANGAEWRATFTIPAMCVEDAKKLRALVSAADGLAGLVLINADKRIPDSRKARYTDGFAFSDVTTFADNITSFAGAVTVSATSSRDSQVDEITITLPATISVSEIVGMIIGIGDPFGSRGGYQTVEVSSIVSLSGQDATMKIRPRLRRSITANDPVYIGSPPMRMRFTTDDPAGSIIMQRGYMLPATFDMVEAD